MLMAKEDWIEIEEEPSRFHSQRRKGWKCPHCGEKRLYCYTNDSFCGYRVVNRIRDAADWPKHGCLPRRPPKPVKIVMQQSKEVTPADAPEGTRSEVSPLRPNGNRYLWEMPDPHRPKTREGTTKRQPSKPL
jgi:hypothetical protein